MAPIAHARLVLGAASIEYLLQIVLKRYLDSEITLRRNAPRTPRDSLLLAHRIIGGVHSTLTGCLALREAVKDHWKEDDLIYTKSDRGNQIIAVELGFLVQDTAFLLLNRRKWDDRRFIRRVVAHHLAYGSLMLWWLRAVEKGYDKGIFFVISFMIMNLSNPLRYLSWGIKKYLSPSSQKDLTLHVLRVAALLVYAATRLALFYYLIWTYGQRKGLNTIRAFLSLPLVCRCTTSAIVIGNSIRLFQLSFSKRKKFS